MGEEDGVLPCDTKVLPTPLYLCNGTYKDLTLNFLATLMKLVYGPNKEAQQKLVM